MSFPWGEGPVIFEGFVPNVPALDLRKRLRSYASREVSGLLRPSTRTTTQFGKFSLHLFPTQLSSGNRYQKGRGALFLVPLPGVCTCFAPPNLCLPFQGRLLHPEAGPHVLRTKANPTNNRYPNIQCYKRVPTPHHHRQRPIHSRKTRISSFSRLRTC